MTNTSVVKATYVIIWSKSVHFVLESTWKLQLLCTLYFIVCYALLVDLHYFL